MEQDSSDICLNIFSSPIEERSAPKINKRVSKKRKRELDKLSARTNLVRPSETSAPTNAWRILKDQTSQDQPTFIRPNSVARPPSNITTEADGNKNASLTLKTTRTQHIRGIGLPKKVKKSKTVTFDEEGDSGVEVDGEYNRAKHSTSSSGVSSSLFGNNPEIPTFAQRAVKPVKESVFSTDHFKDLPVHPYMISNLVQNLNITKLTTVQQKSIPVIMSGSDALVRSQTGSGKTLAYALPIVEALQKIQPKLPRSAGIQAVVVVPTRELALQTYELFVKLVKPFNWLVPGYLVGGEKRKSEKARLRKGITILIGTPGRILDHITNTEVMLIDSVKWLVLDEADRLLDMGYEKDVSSLVSAIDEQALKNPDIFKLDEDQKPTVIKRQTVLVSATLTSGVERLAGLALNTPTYVDAATDCDNATRIPGATDDNADMSIPESLLQYYMITPPKLRLVTLSAFIVSKCQFSDQRKMLVFMATQDMVDFHLELLLSVLGSSDSRTDGDEDSDDDDEHKSDSMVDVEFFKLHGSMSQKDRTECFKTFRKAKSGVLLCTDVAARGLDLPHVDWIVQYTAPCSVSDYVHRVGRTARVGHAGSALILLTTTEVEFVRQLEDRRIRLQEETMEKCLQNLQLFNQPAMTRRTPTVEEAATTLQLRFEKSVMEGSGMHGLACKAYISFVRFYASFPKEGRKIFAFKNLHLGHYAKCFALRDPPSSINGIGRKKWSDDSNNKTQKKQFTSSGPNKGKSQQPMRTNSSGQSRSRELVISEYSSGMPAKKKRKT